MLDQSELAKALQDALIEEDIHKKILKDYPSRGSEAVLKGHDPKSAAEAYVRTHLRVKALRAAVAKEMEIQEPSIEEVMK